MHRAFTIAEIVQMICSGIGPPRGDGSGQALAALARTCKAFKTLHLIFYGLWDEENVENQPLAMGLGAAQILCKRVRVLGLDHSTHFDFTEAFATVDLCPPPEGTFPHLHTLDWRYRKYPSPKTPDFRPFSGANIFDISLGEFGSGAQLSLLPHIARQYPSLKKLFIDSYTYSHFDAQIRTISALVFSLLKLESLDVYHLDKAALQHVSRLPNFEYLSLHKLPLVPSSQASGSASGGALIPALETLKVWVGVTIQSITAFLNLWSISPLRDFHAAFTACPTTDEIISFHIALTTHCAHTTLESLLTFVSHVPAANNAEPYPLRPLFCFVNLINVHILAPVGFDLDDATMSDMAQAWPHLEELVLSVLELPISASLRVRLASLRSLAKHCPRLENLQLAPDATSVPPVAPRISQDNLWRMHVDSSPIGAAMPVAKFLTALFPALTSIPTELEHLPDNAFTVD
ncbi:hypothetical protein C8R43DRAFT_1147598 [Mycena crocata]|nr:hypothetical protein C8R43DRAFT_1147598 [Mycena crocata]